MYTCLAVLYAEFCAFVAGKAAVVLLFEFSDCFLCLRGWCLTTCFGVVVL